MKVQKPKWGRRSVIVNGVKVGEIAGIGPTYRCEVAGRSEFETTSIKKATEWFKRRFQA